MPIYVSDKGGGGDYTPAPNGTHRGVCIDINDLGEVLQKGMNGKPDRNVHKIDVYWEIDEEIPGQSGKNFYVRKRYTASLSEKANLRKDAESWRSRAFTADELAKFDVERMIGAPCLLSILQEPDATGKMWANVKAIMPLPKGMQPMTPTPGYVRLKDRPKDGQSQQPDQHPSDADAPPVDDLDEIPF